MSLREWLIVIGALVILGVIVDGVRRMRRARLDSWEVSQGMGGGDIGHSPVDDDYNPELPTGGARVVTPGARDEPERGVESPEPSEPDEAFESPETVFPEEQARETVADPLVSEPAAHQSAPTASGAATDEVPEPDAPADVPDDDGIVGEVRVRSPEPEEPVAADPMDDGLKAERDDWAEPGSAGHDSGGHNFSARAIWQRIRDGATGAHQGSSDDRGPSGESVSSTGESPASSAGPEERPAAGANRPDASEVIVINVICRGEDERFSGPTLKKLLEACGMEYGAMGIYHRHEEPDTRTPVQFSAASAVSPGTFHPEEMEQLQTPGISFFMSLPGPSDSIQAFDFMMETAQTVVRNLGGELKDENRSVMTAQTIEHCRQRIREFERKQRFVRN